MMKTFNVTKDKHNDMKSLKYRKTSLTKILVTFINKKESGNHNLSEVCWTVYKRNSRRDTQYI